MEHSDGTRCGAAALDDRPGSRPRHRV